MSNNTDAQTISYEIAMADYTEALADSVLVSEVILPGQVVLQRVYFGWDNFVYDEIENLIELHSLAGGIDDYEMLLTNKEGSKVLKPNQVVEFYKDDLTLNCSVILRPKLTHMNTAGLNTFGIKSKSLEEEKEKL